MNKKIYDRDIREPLFEFLEEKYGKVRILEEKRTGEARVDAVMITDSVLYGIEIKSDADTYTRLSGQVENYDKYYDRNYVVVGTRHAGHIEEHVPPYWGIITVEPVSGDDNEAESLDFYVLREPSDNPNVIPSKKLTILWRPELAHIQELNGLHKYAGKSKEYVRDYVIDSVEPERLYSEMTDELFERDYSTIGERINKYRVEHGQHRRKNIKKRKRIYKG